MYPTDEPFAVKRAIMTAHDLAQMLKGYGSPSITADATVDGESLADTLKALRRAIDEFLSLGHP